MAIASEAQIEIAFEITRVFYSKRVSVVDRVVNFKDSSRPNKEIKYFSRRLLKFKTFQDCTNHVFIFRSFVSVLVVQHVLAIRKGVKYTFLKDRLRRTTG